MDIYDRFGNLSEELLDAKIFSDYMVSDFISCRELIEELDPNTVEYGVGNCKEGQITDLVVWTERKVILFVRDQYNFVFVINRYTK